MLLDAKKFTCVIFLVAILTSCSANKLKIVDEKGEPINDVIVLSGKRPFLVGRQARMVCLSSENGEVNVVPSYSDIVIYKPGYFPLFNDSRTPNAPDWSKLKMSSPVKLYKIPSEYFENRLDTEEILSVIAPSVEEMVLIKHSFFDGKIVAKYNTDKKVIIITPEKNWNVLLAKNFFFDESFSVNEKIAKRNINGERKIFFYLINDSLKKTYKIAMAYTGNVYLPNSNISFKFDFKLAEIVSPKKVVYPQLGPWIKNINVIKNGYSKGDKLESCRKNKPSLIDSKLFQYFGVNLDDF